MLHCIVLTCASDAFHTDMAFVSTDLQADLFVDVLRIYTH